MENDKKEDEFISKKKTLILFAVAALILCFVVLIAIFGRPEPISPIAPFVPEKPAEKNISDLKKFSSEQDFKDYLDASSKLAEGYDGTFGAGRIMSEEAFPLPSDMTAKNSALGIGGGEPERVSGTNVQVAGIDEPDIVKTDGKEIYFSGEQRFYPVMRENISSGISLEEQKTIAPYSYPVPQAETKIIKAFPPADLALEGKIDKQGNLLLDENILAVFPSQNYYGETKQEITAYDVSNPKLLVKKWNMALGNNTSIAASRLRDGKICLITRNNINTPRPCPFVPLSADGVDVNIRCADIYHPVVPVPIDTTFVAMELNAKTGKVEKTVSFVGSSGQSVIYVSDSAIYATYTYSESIAKFFSGFVKENSDLFPSWLLQKVAQLETYDISENSKLSEITILLEKFTNSLNNDESLKMQNETTNRMSAYYKKHSRDLEKTGIVKIDLAKFQIASSGAVPGHLLNNFAMDEYQDNLRIATTIGSRWGIFNGIGNGESVSDVYVLDKNLKTLGSVQDLGKTEQIYSVRFVEDKGYVVTFRQTDPFYIVDLANPTNPKITGELKIPGYSSYLHPLDATHILGIGMEGSKVKISLFDVSDKNHPVEMDKYMLDEYWTEVSNNYHAFLLDTKHSIFFLPGSKGGYVFSYNTGMLDNPWQCRIFDKEHQTWVTDNCEKYLTLQKAISQNSVKRAIYLNDYLYIIGEDKITVLNELDWEKVNELDLR